MTSSSNTPPVENRAAFFGRLSLVMAPSDLLKIEVAYALAKHAHRWQTRKELDDEGSPIRYFEHLRATALIMIDELGIVDCDGIISCLMHDALEDTTDISDRMLEHLFGPKVCLNVKIVTKTPENKAVYYDNLMTYGYPMVWIVKGCDRLSNLRTLDQCSKEFQAKQVHETMRVILPMLRALTNTPGYSNIGQRLCGLIETQLYIVQSRL